MVYPSSVLPISQNLEIGAGLKRLLGGKRIGNGDRLNPGAPATLCFFKSPNYYKQIPRINGGTAAPFHS
jgi:hypothetical protein